MWGYKNAKPFLMNNTEHIYSTPTKFINQSHQDIKLLKRKSQKWPRGSISLEGLFSLYIFNSFKYPINIDKTWQKN